MVSLIAPLHVKLLRDLVRLWPQVLAIAFVVAAGVATLVLGVGAIRSLTDTRDAYLSRVAAVDAGFSDQSHFNRACRDLYGLPPVRLMARAA